MRPYYVQKIVLVPNQRLFCSRKKIDTFVGRRRRCRSLPSSKSSAIGMRSSLAKILFSSLSLPIFSLLFQFVIDSAFAAAVVVVVVVVLAIADAVVDVVAASVVILVVAVAVVDVVSATVVIVVVRVAVIVIVAVAVVVLL